MVHRVVSRLSHSKALNRLLCNLGRGWQIISITISSGMSEWKRKLFIDFLNSSDKITDSWGCTFFRDFGCLWSSDSIRAGWSIEEVEGGGVSFICGLMVGLAISCIGLLALTTNDGAAEATTCRIWERRSISTSFLCWRFFKNFMASSTMLVLSRFHQYQAISAKDWVIWHPSKRGLSAHKMQYAIPQFS